MRRLYHFCLQPSSRKLRILLKEKGLEFELQTENAWERRDAFLALNHAGETPVLVEEDGTAIGDATAIAEYIEEIHPAPAFLGTTPGQRAEVSPFDRPGLQGRTEHRRVPSDHLR